MASYIHNLRQFIQKPIFPLLLVNFIGALGYSVILPFLVFLVLDFGGEAVMYGMIAAVYPAFQLVGAPVLGSWSDRIGRKKVLIVSQAGTLLSWIIFLLAFVFPTEVLFKINTWGIGLLAFSIPILLLFLARALDGLTGGNISVANAYLSDISDDRTRKANFGEMSASMNLGFIMGPSIAGFLSSMPNGNMLTVMTAMVISIIGLLVIIFVLPDVKPADEVDLCQEEKTKKTLNIEHKDCYDQVHAQAKANLFKMPRVPFMITLYFLIFLGFNFFYATFPVYSSTNLQWTPQQLGVFFTILSTVMIVVQGPVLSRISNRFSEEQLFLAGAVIMTGTFTCLSQGNMWLVYLAAVLFGAGNGIMWPSYLAMLAKTGPAQNQGSLQGIANSFGSMASIIGLVSGGFILNLLVEKTYLLSAGILLIIAISGFYVFKIRADAMQAEST